MLLSGSTEPQRSFFSQGAASDPTADNTCSGWDPNTDTNADRHDGYSAGRAGSPLAGRSDDKLLISVEEAAQRLDIGRTLFFELIRSGRIRTIRVGRLRKVPIESLRDFVERQSASEAAELR